MPYTMARYRFFARLDVITEASSIASLMHKDETL